MMSGVCYIAAMTVGMNLGMPLAELLSPRTGPSAGWMLTAMVAGMVWGMVWIDSLGVSISRMRTRSLVRYAHFEDLRDCQPQGALTQYVRTPPIGAGRPPRHQSAP